MVLGDENVCMLVKSEKKSKKRKKSASTNDLGGTKGDVKAVEHDLSFKEKKLSFLVTRKERDAIKMETKAPGESEGCNIKSKKERGVGTQPRMSSRDSCEDAMKDVVETKYRLKNERETVHDALLVSKKVVPKTASEACDTEVVETLGEGSGGNDSDVVKRKNRKMEKRKKEDAQVNIVSGVNQGDASTIEDIEDSKTDNANIRKRKKTKLMHNSEDLPHERSEKRVRFSCNVKVYPPSSDPIDDNNKNNNNNNIPSGIPQVGSGEGEMYADLTPTKVERHEIKGENVLWGKRFTQEEDEIVKEAVYRYIEAYNLGDQGLEKVLDSKSNPELRGCWRKIASAIPYRPYRAVYNRAQLLFRRGEKRKWTEEEYEMVRNFHREHGPKWKVLADELGRHCIHASDAWRRIKLPRKKGHWSQEEIQTLFDLVNTNMQLKLCEEKKSKHGMLRDNIPWSAISDKLCTRNNSHCCKKWYRQLTSPMVAKGEWADADDYRLIDALFELDASCLEDVDWDNILDHRPGEVCRKRWKQMVRHVSQHENKSFAAQVELLAKRYRPDLVGAREAWDSKPVVP